MSITSIRPENIGKSQFLNLSSTNSPLRRELNSNSIASAQGYASCLGSIFNTITNFFRAFFNLITCNYWRKDQTETSSVKQEEEEVSSDDESSDEDIQECAICLSEVADPITLECGHVFDKGCLQQWVVEKATCPKDRKNLTQEDFDKLFPKKK